MTRVKVCWPLAVLAAAAGWARWWYRRGWAHGRHTGWHELAPTPGGCFLCTGEDEAEQ